ncbi:hypothetical protein FC70_GL001581 [Paucilactobacillus oligofermentans DSM 15707 = LMG 22743]|uniref:Uncharacterized protein n=2 Tax=Paucilactobacillus oligofermentans TaxID=293371 RepID=A0A0R1RMP5_9LACO|nr:hypothetical protein FC70_GL001581 [Paucilactobacillus oligofermentans DSM 15707 = LMG 22743]
MITVLEKTKEFMRKNDIQYRKEYIRPMMITQHVYVFKFGKHELNNRVIIRYSHSWTGRLKINEIDLRLHKQHRPRIFKTEAGLVDYLESHLQSNILKNVGHSQAAEDSTEDFIDDDDQNQTK